MNALETIHDKTVCILIDTGSAMYARLSFPVVISSETTFYRLFYPAIATLDTETFDSFTANEAGK